MMVMVSVGMELSWPMKAVVSRRNALSGKMYSRLARHIDCMSGMRLKLAPLSPAPPLIIGIATVKGEHSIPVTTFLKMAREMAQSTVR